ncbi:hypothetical protein Snas_3341 [Stackebrandtia nassauensis DSM 44728]|uniref:DinB-like domain-containing protein n=2 Tax=Stackebrandtia TaxID=283810 RepID=D3PUJ4_STANL|nr:hypothetical protein Snas_3341 [Stackebrandtia nassauensis DSM 44728]
MLADMRDEVFDQDRACQALSHDRDRLVEAMDSGVADIDRLTFPDGPLTLLDLAVHVTMWDEINLGVVTLALRGRPHWSLDPRWETAEAGGALNVGGVRAGRGLTEELIRHRFHAVRQAHIDTIAEIPRSQWEQELPFAHSGSQPRTLGGLCHYVNTPEADPTRKLTYQHAAVHLGATSLSRAAPTGTG